MILFCWPFFWQLQLWAFIFSISKIVRRGIRFRSRSTERFTERIPLTGSRK